MAKRPKHSGGNRNKTGGNEYVKLENRLVLLAWLNRLVGCENNFDLLKDTKEVAEGFDGEGRSHMFHHLMGRGDKLKIGEDDLSRYDDNILFHLEAMNAKRPEPITLRYFQYLAALYTEIFLDRYFSKAGSLLRELNEFVRQRNARKGPGDPRDPLFGEEAEDLRKLAFWMATGSGKTLLMHMNYRQFLHYNRRPLDNVLLITPNEGLSKQHMNDMKASGISFEKFSLDKSGLDLVDKNVVRVIEITKLVEDKKGGGLSVPVEAFEGNNLIFVDEGHKGSSNTKNEKGWRYLRNKLDATGFTFEYSATFGQAFAAAKNQDLIDEYGKAIVFDYSYKYFYGDGYGKDFHILNLKKETGEDETDMLLLANLLSFYEQKRCFIEQGDSLKPYGLEPPLWVFIGRTVQAQSKGTKENKKLSSDVFTVVKFLHRFLQNKGGWSVKTMEKIIKGKTGLKDNGNDLFKGKFEYLRRSDIDAKSAYEDVLDKVFRAPSGGPLHIADMRGSTDELGLKVGGAEDYFGLIYIGDTSAFKKLVEADDSGIIPEEDSMTGSLFDNLAERDSTVDVLIGAKKFTEGWNSWRVSNMGLLNIGQTEGSEIIQLFGRGVRLRGLDLSLKRSSAIDGEHPAHIRLLETLNIFAVRANYMAQFRDYLEREGVPTEGHVELPLAIRPNKEFLDKHLFVPRIPEDRNFADEYDFLLEPDRAVKVTVDMSLKVESMRSDEAGLRTASLRGGQEQVIPAESLELLDWEGLYLKLIEYKEQKGFRNLAVRLDDAKRILTAKDPLLYRLIADQSVVRPGSFAEVSDLQEAALSILRKYMEKFYRVRQQRWDSEHMVYQALDENDSNFQDYTVKLPRSEADLIKAVKKLIEEGKKIYEQETRELPNIHFDRHLYQPLLVERGDKIKSKPKGLEPSEERFVKDIREYVRAEAGNSLASKEIFLLRNLSRGKGIGFFEKEGFYPDFILWIKDGEKQRIVFIEPHGMRQEKAYWHDERARLHERLREFSGEISGRASLPDVTLDSFIVSATPYDELRELYGEGDWDKERFSNAHILFFERAEHYDYIQKLFALQS